MDLDAFEVVCNENGITAEARAALSSGMQAARIAERGILGAVEVDEGSSEAPRLTCTKVATNRFFHYGLFCLA